MWTFRGGQIGAVTGVSSERVSGSKIGDQNGPSVGKRNNVETDDLFTAE